MTLKSTVAGPPVFIALIWMAVALPTSRAEENRIRVLMLGDQGHHRPSVLAKVLSPVLAREQIDISYTDDVAALNSAKLSNYDCLLLYLNTIELPAANEAALIDFVEQGKGLVALHCASYAFLNSNRYLHLVGGRFCSHETGIFQTHIIDAQHPAMRGVRSFECWDETYVHGDLADDIRVLMVRPHDGVYEPWTWVRKQGKGRVFYTASGHDERAWNLVAYQKLVESGIKWAAGQAVDDAPAIPTEHVELPATVREGGLRAEIPRPVSPEISMRHMHLPEGFHVELVAREPDIVKPVSMAFDELGRLWVVESQDYPETILPPGVPGHDRIVVCQDTHGTGRMDRFSVFADHLNLPQGICPVNGGVVIAMSPEILFLKDSKGDGHADVRQILYSGFGRSDTHAMHGNFQYALDNSIWATCGYSGFDVKLNENEYKSGQCLFRFGGHAPIFEIITPTSNNTWGLGFNESGEVFASTANNSHSIFMAIPNRYFESVRGWSGIGSAEIEDHKKAHTIGDVRQWDFQGGFTAACGHTVYTARAFPPEYWDKVAFVCEPTDHIIHADLLSSSGSGYVSHDGYNLLASDDSYVSPIQSVVGPDGSLYFIDWYTYVVQHNPTPAGYHTGPGGAYVTPLRDKQHGRIYRIVYDGPRSNKPLPRLDPLNPTTLVEGLKNDNQFWRLQAQRLLVERKKLDVEPALVELASETATDDTGNAPGVIHALWTLHGLGAMDASHPRAVAAAAAALKHTVPGVREAALQVLPRTSGSLSAVLAAGACNDADLHVRRMAFLSIADLPPSVTAAEALWTSLKDPLNVKDRWLRDALTAAAAHNDLAFLTLAARSEDRSQATATKTALVNLISNGDFSAMNSAAPVGWRTVIYSGQADFALERGPAGAAVRISSTAGADAGWLNTFAVEPHTNYRLSGWIKTQNVSPGSSLGALLNVHELQSPRVITSALSGNNNWTRVETTFDSEEYHQLSVNCLLGGWGRAKGTAWYENVRVDKVGDGEPLGMPIVRTVANHYARGLPADTVSDLLAAIASHKPQAATAILDGLVAGWPPNQAPKAEHQNLASLLDGCMAALEPDRQELVGRLAARWRVQSQAIANAWAAGIAHVRKQLTDSAGSDASRTAAAEELMESADDGETAKVIAEQIKPQSTQTLSIGLIRALGRSRQSSVAQLLADRWRFLAPSARSEAIDQFLRNPRWTMVLLDAMEKDVIARADLSNQQLSALTGNSDLKIAERAAAVLAKRGQLPNADRQKIVDAFAAITTKKGDVERGRQVFMKNCSVCHTFNGVGGQVGPDLTGVMNGNKMDILIAVLDPSRSVEGNYRLWVVSTRNGDAFGGRLVSETKNAFEMLDTSGKPHTILRDNVVKMAMQNKSIMPDGFESLGAEQLTDVLEFLARPKVSLTH